MGARRKAREAALQVLYQLDLQDGEGTLSVEDALRRYFLAFADESPLNDTPEGRDFTEALVRGVWDRRDEIDAVVQRASRNWRLDRMSRVDRNILRLATYEIAFGREVPAKAALNEAIEIAKRFGSADSPAFVNGVLDRIAQEVGH